MAKRYKHGFTLMEVTIVIVVIALVMSGVFVGRNMMGAAEMRTVIAEYDMYHKAVREFSDKYQSMPGDFINAEDNWDTDNTAGTCPNITDYTTLRRETCNGNGDGTIGNWRDNDPVTYVFNEYEWFRAWQHLANAGMIDMQLTGVRASGASTATTIGTNVPRSKITRNSGWTLMYMATSSSVTDTNFYFAPVATHALIFGAQTTNSFTDAAILKPLEARDVDDKIDDGMPYTGNLRVKKINNNNCASTGAAVVTDTYRVTDTQNRCQLLFLMGM